MQELYEIRFCFCRLLLLLLLFYLIDCKKSAGEVGAPTSPAHSRPSAEYTNLHH